MQLLLEFGANPDERIFDWQSLVENPYQFDPCISSIDGETEVEYDEFLEEEGDDVMACVEAWYQEGLVVTRPKRPRPHPTDGGRRARLYFFLIPALLQLCADVEAVDSDGRPALMLAVNTRPRLNTCLTAARTLTRSTILEGRR